MINLDQCKKHPTHLFATKMMFSIIRRFLFFELALEENPETPGVYKLLKTLIFFVKFPKFLPKFAW